jgi:hypothetical protein
MHGQVMDAQVMNAQVMNAQTAPGGRNLVVVAAAAGCFPKVIICYCTMQGFA